MVYVRFRFRSSFYLLESYRSRTLFRYSATILLLVQACTLCFCLCLSLFLSLSVSLSVCLVVSLSLSLCLSLTLSPSPPSLSLSLFPPSLSLSPLSLPLSLPPPSLVVHFPSTTRLRNYLFADIVSAAILQSCLHLAQNQHSHQIQPANLEVSLLIH